MFNQVYAIAVKEIKVALRDHGLLPLLLLMPAMFMLILSMGGGAAAPRRMEIAAVNEDQGEVAARIVQRIRQDTAFSLRDAANGAPMSRLAAEEQLKNRESGPLLVVEFPADFSQRLSSQTPASIAFAEAPTDGAAAIHAGEERVKMLAASEVSSWQSLRVGQNALDTLAAQAAAAGQKDFANVNQEFARAIAQEGNATPPALVFQQVSADQGNGSKTPGRAEHNVPAYTIFGIFFIVQVIATSLLREREGGTFQRLHTAPVARAVLLLGKLLPFYLINTVQAAILLGLGHLFFHVSLGTSLSALLLMTLGTVAAANALGLFVRHRQNAGADGAHGCGDPAGHGRGRWAIRIRGPDAAFPASAGVDQSGRHGAAGIRGHRLARFGSIGDSTLCRDSVCLCALYLWHRRVEVSHGLGP